MIHARLSTGSYTGPPKFFTPTCQFFKRIYPSYPWHFASLHQQKSRSFFFYQNSWSFEFQSLKLIFLCLISVSHPPRPLRFWLFLKRNATHGLVVWIYVCLLALRFLSFKGKMCCLPEKEECKNWRRNEVQPWFIIYHIISYHIISGRMLNSEEDRCA